MCTWMMVWDICCWWEYMIHERWTGDACFVLVHKGDLCKCECWTWTNVTILWYHYELLNDDIGWSLVVLLIVAYQLLMNIEVKATSRRGLPQMKMATDSRNWKKYIYGGDSHKLNDYMLGIPTIQMNIWWGLSQT